ncbi:hypothetical protein HK096_001761, partial [Nowakowskiella sp. JEL0078]
VEDEYKKRNTLQSTINRESEASTLLKTLTQALAAERQQQSDESSDRNLVIQQLKDTIQEINALTQSEQRYIRKETKARESCVRQQCHWKESLLEDEKREVLVALEEERKAHEKILAYLHSMRNTMDATIQDWMTRYETDTEAKAFELEALKVRRVADLDKFEELVASYEELEKVVEEDRLVKAREAEEARIATLRIRAASRIQRWWKRLIEKRKVMLGLRMQVTCN